MITRNMETKHHMDYIGNRIVEYLKTSNHDIKLASCTGYRTDKPTVYYDWFNIGILKNDAVRHWWRGKSRRTFLGVLWIDNKLRKASSNDNLIFELNDENNSELAEHICKDIMDRFQVKISIHVLDKRVHATKEGRDSDHGL